LLGWPPADSPAHGRRGQPRPHRGRALRCWPDLLAGPVRALLIGDVVGGVGLRAVLDRLPDLREEHRPDLVVVNAENAAAGAGTSARQARDLLDAGVDVLTGGNHTFRQRDFYPMLETEPRVLRPANLSDRAPGH